MIPLYTTAATYPWYRTTHPVAMSLSTSTKSPFVDPDPAAPSNNPLFKYRFVIHRAGNFHRYEDRSDYEAEMQEEGEGDEAIAMDIGMDSTNPGQRETTEELYHQLPLRLLANRESYVVNNVLGKTSGPPDIEHYRVDHNSSAGFGGSTGGGGSRTTSVDTLHSRTSSLTQATVGSGSALASAVGSAATAAARKKAVGFAPPPPPYHRAKDHASVQAVHLNSTDGLVVVSAFLPVVLRRSDQGQWSADWDYEVLLSMQTHLRVTRIGVVKWRGWHGNTGSQGSPEAGVPFNERRLVEECLRPFNCVPVWMDTALFGEMYVLSCFHSFHLVTNPPHHSIYY
jgi:hypothetical protein